MSRWTRKALTRRKRSRRLHFDCLEPRLCLSTYATIDLFPSPGHDHATAFGLNDNGLAVGASHLVGNSTEDAAVVWSVDLAGDVSVSSLPGIDDARSIRAVEVNNQGIIVGESWIPEDTSGDRFAHAVFWTGNPGSYAAHDLDTLAYLDLPEETAYEDFLYSGAKSVSEPDANGHYWVVGTSSDTSVTPQVHRGVLWQVDATGNVLSMTDLEPGSDNVAANDVRMVGNSVFVAGDFVPEGSGVQACIWETESIFDPVQGKYVVTVVARTDLPTFTGDSAPNDFRAVSAFALNNDLDVAGWGYNSAQERKGFLYQNSADSITDLGSLGNSGSYAWGMNDSDVVVGSYQNVKSQGFYSIDERAFVWENGTMYDLLNQVSDRTFWLLFSANDVNEHGEIVGNGRAGKRNDSHEHGFLARPEGDAAQQAPQANDDAYSMQPNTMLTVAAPGVLVNDTDADPLTAMLAAGPSSGTLSLSPDGSFTYTPEAGFIGADGFTYVASDGQLDSNEATVTITVSSFDPPQVSITDVSKREGRTGKTTTFTFTVTRLGDTSEEITILYATVDGTATAADGDYLETSGSLTFAPGETTKTITVTIIGDREPEDHETFDVRLTDEFFDELAIGTGTIINDDK
jgi:hypothetical protein